MFDGKVRSREERRLLLFLLNDDDDDDEGYLQSTWLKGCSEIEKTEDRSTLIGPTYSLPLLLHWVV